MNPQAFKIKTGISKEQVTQLINYSNTDPEILKFTRDKVRFRDHKAYTKWRQKKRIIYTLVDEKNNLLGVTWFGEKIKQDYKYFKKFDPQHYSITFSISKAKSTTDLSVGELLSAKN